MTGRQSQSVSLALRLVRERGYSVTAAAKKHGVDVTSVRRALRAAGVAPLARGRKSKKAPSIAAEG